MLATTCPTERRKVREKLCEAFACADSEVNWRERLETMQRRDSRYGVTICHEQQNVLRKLGWTLTVLNYDPKNSKLEELYLDILRAFHQGGLVVYVTGLTFASDLFLKNCCEFTERTVWRWIFFDGLDATYNFPEIRDRIEQLQSKATRIITPAKTVSMREYAKCDAARVQRIKASWAFEEEPPEECDWQEETADFLCKNKRCVLLLCSAPGAGKVRDLFFSFFFLSYFFQEGCVCVCVFFLNLPTPQPKELHCKGATSKASALCRTCVL